MKRRTYPSKSLNKKQQRDQMLLLETMRAGLKDTIDDICKRHGWELPIDQANTDALTPPTTKTID